MRCVNMRQDCADTDYSVWLRTLKSVICFCIGDVKASGFFFSSVIQWSKLPNQNRVKVPIGRYLKLPELCLALQITVDCKNKKELTLIRALFNFKVSTSDQLEQLTESELGLFNYFSFRYAIWDSYMNCSITLWNNTICCFYSHTN